MENVQPDFLGVRDNPGHVQCTTLRFRFSAPAYSRHEAVSSPDFPFLLLPYMENMEKLYRLSLRHKIQKEKKPVFQNARRQSVCFGMVLAILAWICLKKQEQPSMQKAPCSNNTSDFFAYLFDGSLFSYLLIFSFSSWISSLFCFLRVWKHRAFRRRGASPQTG